MGGVLDFCGCCGESPQAFARKIAFLASVSGALFGYDTGVVSGATVYIVRFMNLSHLEAEVMVSSTVAAAAVGAVAGGMAIDRYSRRKVLLFASVLFVLGALLMALAFGPRRGFYMLVFGRIVVGLAVGAASEAGPVYIAEATPMAVRGAMITSFNVAVVAGQMIAGLVCGAFSYLGPSMNWRLMLGAGSLPAIVQFVGFLQMPSSPHWLVYKGKQDEALNVLQKVRDPSEVAQELESIKNCVRLAEEGSKVSLLQLWISNAPVRKAMALGCLLWFASQYAGINTIMYYGASILEMAGFGNMFVRDDEGATHFNIWMTAPLALLQLVGVLLCFHVIDRCGRRNTLFISLSFVVLFLMVMAVSFMLDFPSVTAAGMGGYLLAFGFGLSTMPYAVNAEIYPIQYRSVCTAQANFVFWATNFAVSLTFLTLTDCITTAGSFLLYAGGTVVIGFVLWLFLPETSGKSLEEVQALFEKSTGDSCSWKDLCCCWYKERYKQMHDENDSPIRKYGSDDESNAVAEVGTVVSA